MNDKKSILKDSPDYEDYTVNEAKLTIDEKKQMGLMKCGGCCSKKNGCESKKGCCKNGITLSKKGE